MAHFVLEYSNNVEEETLALEKLFKNLHDKALETGVFPYKGIRSRAYPCEIFRIADGNPNHMFVHLTVLIGAGRSKEIKENVANALYTVYEQHFSSCFSQRGVALSFELRELEPVFKFNKNNIESYL